MTGRSLVSLRALFLLLLLVGIVALQAPAGATPLPVLTVTPITFDIIGLDSNNSTATGPSDFPVGARFCNSTGAAATGVTATFVRDGAVNSYLSLVDAPTQTFASIAPSACVDAYFTVRIQRTSAAFNTIQPYHIAVSAPGFADSQTPAGRQLNISGLLSQSRNSVLGIDGPTNVSVGQSYTFTVRSHTSTTFPAVENFLNLSNIIFRINTVRTVFSSPTGATDDKFFTDACGLNLDPTNSKYLTCVGPVNYVGGGVGGDVTTAYSVTVLSSGTTTLTSLMVDGTAKNLHYNSDFCVGSCPTVNSKTITSQMPSGTATALAMAAASGPSGGTASLSATLTVGGAPLVGQTVAFTLMGAAVGSATTDANGVATLDGASLGGINSGTYTNAVVANYAGDGEGYAGSSGANNLVVSAASNTTTSNTAATAIILTSGSGTYGGNATLTATLGAGTAPLTGQTITFSLNGSDVGTATTDANGVATLSGVDLTGTAAGSYTNAVGARFAGDTTYAASQANGDLTVGQATASLTLGGLGQVYDSSAKSATVTTSPANLTPVSLTYNGSMTAPTEPGSYAVVAHLTNANYAAPDAIGTLVIAKAQATLALGALGPFTYDGTAKGTTATTTPAGLNGVIITYNGSTTAPTNAGSYAVVASLNDPHYAASDATGTLVIAKATATLTLGGLTQTYTGQPLPATATTVPGGLGSIALTYDGAATAPTNVGSYAVVATLNDPNYAGTTSGTLTIVKANQALTFPTLGNRTYGDAPFAIGATLDSGLPPVYAASGNCSLNNDTLTLTGAGSCTVTVSHPGDANHNAVAAVSQTFAIAKNTPTITWNPTTPLAYGTPLGDAQLDATVSNVPGTGTAVAGAFTYNPAKGAMLGIGTQVLTVGFIPFDTANFVGSSATATITVTSGGQAITFAALPNRTYGDAPFGIGATASTGLPVGFGAAGQCTVTPNGTGTAMVTLTGAGSCAITATQPGDANHDASTPVTRTFTIAKATPIITWAAPAPITQGIALSSVQLNATATVPGTFVYTPAAGTVLGTGTQTLAVLFTPDDLDNNAITTANTSIGVGLSAQTLTFAALPDRTFGDAPVALVATTDSGLPIVFTTTGPCTVAGTTLTITGAGSCTVVAGQAGGGGYAPASLSRTFAIAKATPVITWATPAPITQGTALSATQLNATAPIPGAFIYDPAVGTVLAAGVQPLKVIFIPFDSSNHVGTIATVTLTVNRIPQTVTFPPLTDAPSLGNPIPLKATTDTGRPITYSATGPCRIEGSTVIPTGTGTCTVTATQPGDGTYAPSSGIQSFQIGTVAGGYLLTLTTDGGGSVGATPAPNVQATRYSAGTLVTLAPQGPASAILVGWRVDGTFQGWAAPLTLTMNGDHAVQAVYRTRPTFSDVSSGTFGAEAIGQLAARGIIKGYGDGSFGPRDLVLRAQIAAMVARATGSDAASGPGIGPSTWATEDHGNHFGDRGPVDSELWRTIGSLEFHGVARGYDAATYDPTGTVSHAQTISLITRAMVAKGYWTQQPDDARLYPGIPAGNAHRQDIATYVHYVGALPLTATTDRYDDPNGWDGAASRAWVAQALWTALDSYHNVDRVP